MDSGSWPRPTDDDRAWFASLLPDAPDVRARKMFGNEGAFVGDQMFACLSGSRVAVRLGEAERTALLEVPGTEPFEPMPGRPMKEYVVLPDAWRDEHAVASDWVERSRAYEVAAAEAEALTRPLRRARSRTASPPAGCRTWR